MILVYKITVPFESSSKTGQNLTNYWKLDEFLIIQIINPFFQGVRHESFENLFWVWNFLNELQFVFCPITCWGIDVDEFIGLVFY